MTNTTTIPLRMVAVLAAIVAALGMLALAGRAEASTYTVVECYDGFNGAADDSQVDNPGTGSYVHESSCAAGNDGYTEIRTAGNPAAGTFKQWFYESPEGSYFTRITGRHTRTLNASGSGLSSFLSARPFGQGEQFAAQLTGAGSVSESFDTNAWNGPSGPFTKIAAGVTCQRSSGNCNNIYATSQLQDLGFFVTDYTAPDAPTLGGSITSGWVNGTKTLNYGLRDVGAGVYQSSVHVNGSSAVDSSTYCNPATVGFGSATRLQPCDRNESDSTDLNVGGSQFVQGANTLTVYVSEWGTGPVVPANSVTVNVDTVAPTAPTSAAVAGGEGWKRDRNDFDLSWSNPAQAHAPIVGASLRITGPGGYDNTTFYSGANRTSINDVAVPNVVGDYTATVYLRDAAGNEAVANGSQLHLRFDNTVPIESAPDRANGWINRIDREDGYTQGWQRPNGLDIPPSGIAGYRVIVNTNSDTDPCAGAVPDPRTCSGPITHPGIGNISDTFGVGELVEGVSYVHVAPVSGSGMRATAVGHTPLKVDVTDPVTVLEGPAADGWINQDVNVRAVATDTLSGMVDTSEFPNDDPPRTVLAFGGQQFTDDDRDVPATISAEGATTVTFWARDLAGNENDGATRHNPPSTQVVRIDKTVPVAGFINRQDPSDPDRLVVPVSDTLSGVVDGKISYRQADGTEWKTLDTKLDGGELVARVDSADLREGTAYQFRASATDRAGNTITTTKRQDGSEMTVVGPFRTITTVSDITVNGKPKATVKYGKGAVVAGKVTTRDGSSVGQTKVELVQQFRSGTKKRTKTITTTTDAGGAFKAKIGRGPSRAISARYAGDKVYLGSSSAQAKLGVKGKVTLKVPSTAKSGGETTFKGKIKAVGAKFPRAGKRMELQVLVGKKWKSVGKSFRSSKKGAWRLDYRFGDFYERPTKFLFRAVVVSERSWPYLPAKSRKRSVTVSP